MEAQATIETLINYVTSDVIQTPDINAQIEIASRFIDNLKDQAAGLSYIDKIMRKGKVKSKYFALCLIEIWSKNGDLRLHENLSNIKFLESFMTLLKRRRGKAGILQK